jgi:hypothetical protein
MIPSFGMVWVCPEVPWWPGSRLLKADSTMQALKWVRIQPEQYVAWSMQASRLSCHECSLSRICALISLTRLEWQISSWYRYALELSARMHQSFWTFICTLSMYLGWCVQVAAYWGDVFRW